MSTTDAFVGLDVHKDSISVAVADAGRDGEIRFWGAIQNHEAAIEGLCTRIERRHGRVEYVYEAGPCGYRLYRQLSARGSICHVISPSHTPRKSADRIKNDTRDALMLARLLRAGELTPIWIPDEIHEAMRDLVRARQMASYDVRKAKQRIQSFLLRHGRRYDGKPWTNRHRTWLGNQSFAHPAQQLAFQSCLNARMQCESRRAEIERQIDELVPAWQLAPVVHALQALRGVAQTIAVALVAEIGDFRRFSHARQLMAFLGLIPSEHSSGTSVRQGGITKAGNVGLRALLFEAAWCYRGAAKVGSYMLARQPDDLPQEALDIGWRAQVRLCSRYRRLVARGKKSQVAVTAVARELVGFIWDIGRRAQPATMAETS